MHYNPIDYLDEFSMWITDLRRVDGRWMVKLYPNRVIDAQSMRFVVDELKKHVINETIVLCCEALGVKPEYITSRGRSQVRCDERFATAIVLKNLFHANIGMVHVGRQMGWADHSMMYHAMSQADVKPVALLVKRIYSRYPFLKDGFKTLRP